MKLLITDAQTPAPTTSTQKEEPPETGGKTPKMGGDDAGVSQGGKTSVPTVEFVTNSRRGGLDWGVKALAKKGEDGGAGGGVGVVEVGGRGGEGAGGGGRRVRSRE